MKMNFKSIVMAGGLCWLILGGGSARAMDRWSALSMLESRNNDSAIGRAGEVSRYQIKPSLWVQFSSGFPVNASRNPRVALWVAQAIMRERCRHFEHRFHRAPTDFEYYVLWAAPAQIQRPGTLVTKHAYKFCNLVRS